MVRQRKKQPPASPNEPDNPPPEKMTGSGADDENGLRVGGPASWSVRTQWIFFAVASGACAAFNGVFAKLTTTDLTTTLSQSIANAFGLSSVEGGVEVVVRGIFFALNLTFNGIMWSLFTTALARGTSTTQVSIMNTSTNFMLTAFLGLLIFSEQLPPMWWAGATLLVAGNVIIGRKDESKEGDADAEQGGYVPVAQGEQRDEEQVPPGKEDEDVIDLGNLEDERR